MGEMNPTLTPKSQHTHMDYFPGYLQYMEKHRKEGQTLHCRPQCRQCCRTTWIRFSSTTLQVPITIQQCPPTALAVVVLLLDVVPSQNCKYQSKVVEGKVEATSHLPRDISRMDTTI